MDKTLPPLKLRNWSGSASIGISALLLLSSCGHQTTPQATASRSTTALGSYTPPSTSTSTSSTTPATTFATQSNKIEVKTALPGVLFLPPTVQNAGQTGPLQDNARVNIEVFKLDGPNSTVTTKDVGPRFSTKDNTISVNGGHYQANWNIADSKLPDGSSVRIELRLDNATEGQAACNAGANADTGCLAYIDAKLWSNQGEANKNGAKNDTTILNLVNGRTLPIKFHINSGAVNTTPKVSILNPTTGAAVTALTLKTNEDLNLNGQASDFEDGDLTKSIDWNIEGIGNIGTGSNAKKTLLSGTYSLTATVKDSQGLVGKTQIQVTVSDPAPVVDNTFNLVAATPAIGSTLGGNEVKLTGTGFTGATDVKFGETSASSFKVIDDHTITAIAPANEQPVNVKVTVVKDKAITNAVYYTYRIPYRISALARPLTASIYQYFDDRLIVKLNDVTIADMDGENLPPGNYPPRILKDFAANDGDKLTFIVVNRFPWACGSGELTLIKPDGSTGSAYPGFVDSNCNDRIGEVSRYEYTLPNGPGKSLPIQAPDITDVAISSNEAGSPTTFNWQLTNPAKANLNCFIDFGDGQSQTLSTCDITGMTQHTYNNPGNYNVRFKVADGPYASGNVYDPQSGNSNGFQKYFTAKVEAKVTNNNPTDTISNTPSQQTTCKSTDKDYYDSQSRMQEYNNKMLTGGYSRNVPVVNNLSEEYVKSVESHLQLKFPPAVFQFFCMTGKNYTHLINGAISGIYPMDYVDDLQNVINYIAEDYPNAVADLPNKDEIFIVDSRDAVFLYLYKSDMQKYSDPPLYAWSITNWTNGIRANIKGEERLSDAFSAWINDMSSNRISSLKSIGVF